MEMPLAFDLVLRDLFVEVGTGSFHIRSNPKGSYTEAKRADEEPANEAEVKKEESHFVAVHHLAAFINALLPGVCRIVVLDVEGHGIAVCLYDTRNNEKQGPKEGKHRNKNSKNDVSSNVRGKATEGVLDFDGFIASCKVQKDFCHTKGQRTHKNKSSDACERNRTEDGGYDQANDQGIKPFGAKNIVSELLARFCTKFRCFCLCHNKFLLKRLICKNIIP